MKKEVKAKRDEQKQDVMRKGRKCFVSREIHFKNTEDFFRKERRDSSNFKGICSQKCLSCMEENRKRRKKDDVSEMKNYVFVRCF